MSTVPLRTVLIFAHECAPYHAPSSTIGAQRVAQFAKHLPSFGWRAIVVCCDARRRGAGFTNEDATRIEQLVRDASPSKSLIVPTPSLAWDGLLDRWWRASMRGSSRAAQRLFWRKPLTVLKQLTHGDYSSAWQPCARRAADIVLRSQHIDACIGEHTPDAGIVLARWFADGTGVPWVVDFRDPVLRPFSRVLRMLYLPRVRSLLSTAAHLISVNDHLADVDRKLLRRPAKSIPNGFDPDEFVAADTRARRDCFKIAYCGNINPKIQTIFPFFDALRLVADKLPNDRAPTVRFVYRGNAADYVRGVARKYGVSDMVDAEALIPREQALQVLQSADVLLLLSLAGPAQQHEHFVHGLYPAKTFEYFGARRPILCIPGDGAMLDELISKTRTGVVLRDPASIAGYLMDSHHRWQQGFAAEYAPDEELVGQFTRKRLTKRLAALLDSLVSARQCTTLEPHVAAVS